MTRRAPSTIARDPQTRLLRWTQTLARPAGLRAAHVTPASGPDGARTGRAAPLWALVAGALAFVGCDARQGGIVDIDADGDAPGWILQIPDAVFADAHETASAWDSSRPEDIDRVVPDAASPDATEDVSSPVDAPPEDTGPAAPISGGVLVAQLDSADVDGVTVTARFRFGASPARNPVATYGDCVVHNATPGQPLPDPGAGLDSGVIQLTGLVQPLTLTPAFQGDAQGWVYPPATFQGAGLPPGGLVTVTAAGGAHLPAWSVQVTSPAPVVVQQPSGSTIDTSAALAMKWNAAGGAAVRLDVFVVDTNGSPLNGSSITCFLTGDPGFATVPAPAMAMLPGDGGAFGLGGDIVVYGVTRITAADIGPSAEELRVALSRSSGGYAAIK